MQPIWLNNYPTNIPKQIAIDPELTIVDYFIASCQAYSDKIAFVQGHKNLSFNELDKMTQVFAGFLQSELKVQVGEKFGIMLPNILQYPVCLFGALRAGLTVVNINPQYSARELEFVLENAEIKYLIVLENFAATVEKAIYEKQLKHLKVIVTSVGDLLGMFEGCLTNLWIRYGAHLVPKYDLPNHINFTQTMQIKKYLPKFNPIKIDARNAIAFLQYTGGTTGKAKAAMLTHANIYANVIQIKTWISGSIDEGKETIITALPLYHIFALTANCLAFLGIGAKNVLIINPRAIKNFISILKSHKFNIITGVNTLYRTLVSHPNFAQLDFSKLKLSIAGGMALQSDVAAKWRDVTKSQLLEAYGLTETSPAVCINPLDLKEFNNSVGLPIPNTLVSIRNNEDQELGVNQIGELWIKGPQVMLGYWKAPDETKAVLSTDGWLKTGDMARIDEKGFVYIVDRKKEMILISGFNVYPNEVEEVLTSLNGVLEAAVVGEPDLRGGEKVVAFIVKEKNITIDDKIILEHCRKNLVPYKVPYKIIFREELPKSNVGKILRRVLQAEFKLKT